MIIKQNFLIKEFDELIYVAGGDGTLLKAFHQFYPTNKPFYTYGTGTLNVFMNKEKYLNKKRHKKIKLTPLKITIDNKETIYAFNEVLIGGNLNSYYEFRVINKFFEIENIRCGGMIISTAQGSTGTNFSNNHIMLPIDSKNFIISTVLSKDKINKIIPFSKINIYAFSRYDEEVTLWIDGVNKIRKGDDICITKGEPIYLYLSKETIKRRNKLFV